MEEEEEEEEEEQSEDEEKQEAEVEEDRDTQTVITPSSHKSEWPQKNMKKESLRAVRLLQLGEIYCIPGDWWT
ncbi:hypothetical protein E2C01_066560 [Portunus trituberculatus]|uniref:Uncharacterized protein n=1 Tax=Portunus trituberculatus TaxID=210409 RepID=A0A5B7HLV2_PORTR|nr:hypothetical protein [Portunus trituberculatus]